MDYDWYVIVYKLNRMEPMVQRVSAGRLDGEIKDTLHYRAPGREDVHVYGVNQEGQLVPTRHYRRQ